MKMVFNEDKICCEELEYNYSYLENDPQKLYELLQLLVNNEENLVFELKTEKLLAKKFYDIITNEFNFLPF